MCSFSPSLFLKRKDFFSIFLRFFCEWKKETFKKENHVNNLTLAHPEKFVDPLNCADVIRAIT